MTKNLIRTLPAAIALSACAFSAHAVEAKDMKWNGFVDFTFTLHDSTDETAGPPGEDESATQSKFAVGSELDLNVDLGNKVGARLDTDFTTAAANGTSGGVASEQAFLTWESPQKLLLKGGVFNNPLGWEGEDAPDKFHVTSGLLYMLWDDTTLLYGNNVAGVSLSGAMQQITLTGALLNDLGNTNEKNSFMAVVNFAPAQGVDLEAGFVSQDAGVESIVDINASFTKGVFMVGGEIMLPSEFVDLAFGVSGVMKFNEQFSGAARFESLAYEDDLVGADVTSITLGVSYMIEKNLLANAELRMFDSDNDDVDGDVITLEMLATF